MAFPISPVNGQIYKQYIYKSSIGAWVKKESEGISTYFPRPAGLTTWDIGPVTPSSTPLVWDISSLVPVGTKAVEITALMHSSGATTALEAGESHVWDYDLGSSPGMGWYGSHGIHIRLSRAAAQTGGNLQNHVANDGVIVIGSSRKLYLKNGLTAYEIYAVIKGYYI